METNHESRSSGIPLEGPVRAGVVSGALAGSIIPIIGTAFGAVFGFGIGMALGLLMLPIVFILVRKTSKETAVIASAFIGVALTVTPSFGIVCWMAFSAGPSGIGLLPFGALFCWLLGMASAWAGKEMAIELILPHSTRTERRAQFGSMTNNATLKRITIGFAMFDLILLIVVLVMSCIS